MLPEFWRSALSTSRSVGKSGGSLLPTGRPGHERPERRIRNKPPTDANPVLHATNRADDAISALRTLWADYCTGPARKESYEDPPRGLSAQPPLLPRTMT